MKTFHALVACSDLTGYAKVSGKKSEEEMFQLLADYYEFLGDVIAPAHGEVIKFMGDAALMLFPEKDADTGVQALLQLQAAGDAFWSERGVSCRHRLRCHFGPVCWGPLGTRADKRPDILGRTINTLFLLKCEGFAITPEAFRKLNPETRKLFKKHTPPVVYIPTRQPHHD
jgi:class 3 adenylate cyclase